MQIAVGILLASGPVQADVSGVLFLGELSLDGGLRHLQGGLPMVGLARDRGIRTVYVPAVDAAEAALVAGAKVMRTTRLTGTRVDRLTMARHSGCRRRASSPWRGPSRIQAAGCSRRTGMDVRE